MNDLSGGVCTINGICRVDDFDMSDPKLKVAMAEIAAIIKKHDIAGHVSLVSPTNSEFRFELEPSWSCIKVEKNGDGSATIRFRSKREEFRSAEEQHEITEKSVWMLLAVKDLAAQTFLQIEGIEAQLKKHMQIDHTPLAGFEPHREQ